MRVSAPKAMRLRILICVFLFLWGEALFLDVPSSNFLGRGDLELRGPLAQSYGAKVKTFNAEISFEIILEI